MRLALPENGLRRKPGWEDPAHLGLPLPAGPHCRLFLSFGPHR